ncbi:adenylate kinase 7 isoform X4 [Hydra vulgaris]|uniref:Adenylate kinase 7 isoform X4 n=1 Tax=Hydra vulgaris TaxID=6087 RepID=A0ABM4CGE0_HYDVU
MMDIQSAVVVRVFVNYVDSFTSNAISKALSLAALNPLTVNQDEETGASGEPQPKSSFQIFGTLKNKSNIKPDWVTAIFENETKEELFIQLKECDVFIYDIFSSSSQVEEAIWLVTALTAEISSFTTQKVFICISTVLTWSKTKPIDPEDPEVPFTEDDYRKRRAHPNYKSHLNCEKLVIKNGKVNKSLFMTYVVIAGVLYGLEENLLHILFKQAWLGGEKALPVFGTGKNTIPMIHVNDLASAVRSIVELKPSVRYLLAVDESKSSLEEITRSISKNLGNNKVEFVNIEDALLENSISQLDYDLLSVNLHMDATFVKENLNFPWISESGFIENIQKVIQEFKTTRGLLPLRVCILGPPAVGKTTVAKQLCEHFKIHHIKIQDVIEEAIKNLKTIAARADKNEDETDDLHAQDAEKLLSDINECKAKNNGRLDDEFIIMFYKEKLSSMPCQNQGYIIDGYPKTMEQAQQLFTAEEDHDDLNESLSKEINTPEFLIALNAYDDFLRSRVINLPESVVNGTHNTEEEWHRRLAEYRALNTEEDSVLNYFDELEIHPEYIDVTQDFSYCMKQTVEKIIQILGKPRNYGLTAEEIEEIKRREREKLVDELCRKEKEKEMLEAEEARDRAKKLEEWRAKLNIVKQQEEEILEIQSIPLRNYLMKHVMPTLTEGLIECCKLRPEDPVDFLAEFLFEKNPQVNL